MICVTPRRLAPILPRARARARESVCSRLATSRRLNRRTNVPLPGQLRSSRRLPEVPPRRTSSGLAEQRWINPRSRETELVMPAPILWLEGLGTLADNASARLTRGQLSTDLNGLGDPMPPGTMRRFPIHALVLCLLLLPNAGHALSGDSARTNFGSEIVTTRHTITVKGTPLAYTARAGFISLIDEATGEIGRAHV